MAVCGPLAGWRQSPPTPTPAALPPHRSKRKNKKRKRKQRPSSPSPSPPSVEPAWEFQSITEDKRRALAHAWAAADAEPVPTVRGHGARACAPAPPPQADPARDPWARRARVCACGCPSGIFAGGGVLRACCGQVHETVLADLRRHRQLSERCECAVPELPPFRSAALKWLMKEAKRRKARRRRRPHHPLPSPHPPLPWHPGAALTRGDAAAMPTCACCFLSTCTCPHSVAVAPRTH